MIILIHDNNKVVKILDSAFVKLDFPVSNSIVSTFVNLCETYKDRLIIWCHEGFVNHINTEELASIFHHKLIFASYNPKDSNYLPKQIGYIDRSFLLTVNKTVSYPTWIASAVVGGVNSDIITSLKSKLNCKSTFDYFLLSISKLTTFEGLLCYSEPKLLLHNAPNTIHYNQASTFELFKFVKQHYKWVWTVFLMFSYLIFESKIKLLPFIKSFFYKRLSSDFDLDKLNIQSTKNIIDKKEVDVIIPTIGRKRYLYDVLKDLSQQTILPKQVIIVEQNPLKDSQSELDYLNYQEWPFKIKHTFTNQTGVVNARNIALTQVESEWVFFADDDIRFNKELFENSFKLIENRAIYALNYLCLQTHQKQSFFKIHQTTVFGSGSSMVKSEALKGLTFNTAYEFGFGEDTEFGMQIRNNGYDVLYTPDIKLIHLKAPIGGYRTKVRQLWDEELIQPKPSPTMMLLYKTYYTAHQLLGYKLLLALRNFKNSNTKNPISYFKKFKKQWESSLFWANKL